MPENSRSQFVVVGEPLPDDPPYVRGLASSARLAVVREVVYFWRSYGIEKFCILTARWLKRLKRFEADIQRYVAAERLSPFVEEAGLQFLHYVAGDSDAVVAALARFELALHETRLDLHEERIVEWPCDPQPILSAILDETEITMPLVSRRHRVRVSRSLPGGFMSELIDNAPDRFEGNCQ
ncbi:hypothetical protein [Synechococcus sp. PCC 7336]|uniref:hypothetical protein n=1 Tax=Synechococcus sp. PCC 7336 TaxID=195250 RepID=UPI000346485D|nr:hypothetical protein [Synechococcus sp. PCC 7336]